MYILTIGQYLQPTKKHLTVEKFYAPEEFEQLEKILSPIFTQPKTRSLKKKGIKVLKFGGRSLANGEGIERVVDIISEKARNTFESYFTEDVNYELLMEIYENALEVSRGRKEH